MTRVSSLFWIFLKLGFVGFGGPPAHIALMEREFVERRRWLSAQDFLALVGLTNLIPGPNSTEVALHIGFRRGGVLGMLVAGAGFILPAVACVLVLSVLYVAYGRLPLIDSFLRGVHPVVAAVTVVAGIRLAKRVLTFETLWFFIVSLVLVLLGVGEVGVLLIAGLLGGFPVASRVGSWAAPLLGAALWGGSAPSGSLLTLGGSFLKIGAVLYGSGFVLPAYIESEFISQRGWLTQAQLLDGIAIGQFTPGPLFSSATFFGFLMAGPWGALFATIAIFLPAFLFVGFLGAFSNYIGNSQRWRMVMSAIAVASLALLVNVGISLTVASTTDEVRFGLFCVALILVLAWEKVIPLAILGGGIASVLVG